MVGDDGAPQLPALALDGLLHLEYDAVGDGMLYADAVDVALPAVDGIGGSQGQRVSGEVWQVGVHVAYVEYGVALLEASRVARVVDHQHAVVHRRCLHPQLVETYGCREHAVGVADLLLHLAEEVVVRLPALERVVAVYLQFAEGRQAVRLVNLAYAPDQLLGEAVVALVHTVLGDIDRRHQLDAVGQPVGERDGGVGHGHRVAHDDVEVSAVDLRDLVLPEEGPLGGVKLHLRAPVVDGIDVAGHFIPSVLLLPAARQCGQQRQEPPVSVSSGNTECHKTQIIVVHRHLSSSVFISSVS